MLLAAAILRSSGEESPVRAAGDALRALGCIRRLQAAQRPDAQLEDHKYESMERGARQLPGHPRGLPQRRIPRRASPDHLRIALDRLGEVPLIVRSSSLLEDSFRRRLSRASTTASSWPTSEPARGTPARSSRSAIAEVYVERLFSPDADRVPSPPRPARLTTSAWAMMIQPRRRATTRYGYYFLPTVAGVAFSRNDYRWSRPHRPRGRARPPRARAGDARGGPGRRLRADGAPEDPHHAARRHARGDRGGVAEAGGRGRPRRRRVRQRAGREGAGGDARQGHRGLRLHHRRGRRALDAGGHARHGARRRNSA